MYVYIYIYIYVYRDVTVSGSVNSHYSARRTHRHIIDRAGAGHTAKHHQFAHANPRHTREPRDQSVPSHSLFLSGCQIRVPFAGFICNLMKSHEHRTRDLLFRLAGQYMLIHVPTMPQLGKHGYVVRALHWHNLQLERARKSLIKYAISLSDLAMPAGICIHGGFVALMINLPVGVDVDILHCTNELQLAREARIEN